MWVAVQTPCRLLRILSFATPTAFATVRRTPAAVGFVLTTASQNLASTQKTSKMKKYQRNLQRIALAHGHRSEQSGGRL